MTKITLPPLPDFAVNALPKVQVDLLLARDLEVARAVLEGAAQMADRYHTGDWHSDDDTGSEVASWLAAQFRALEVSHD
jgi:hypothetical protein